MTSPHAHCRRVLAALSLVLLPLACTSGGSSRAPAERHASGERLAPDPLRIAQDVRWLADDARDGRRAGTAGEAASANWLAQRLEALGMEPAGSEGFLQPFEVPLPVEDGGGSALTVLLAEPRELGASAELRPLFCSAGATVEGALFFAGYGISSSELGRDDYAGRDCSGAIVLIVRGTPPDELLPAPAPAGEEAETPHGGPPPAPAGWRGAGSVFHKVMEAKRRGAAGVVLCQHPAREEPMLAFHEGGTAEARIPALHVSAALAGELVPGYGELVARLDSGEFPAVESGPRVRLVADVVRARGTARNVLGRIRGREPGPALVIGAHFDHLGRGGTGSLAPDQQGQIHNGADDNASGTAAVLEIARVLAGGPQPPSDVLIALWSGEELGLLGSEHWARTVLDVEGGVRANLNLDMVGRAGSGRLTVLGAGSARQFANWLEAAGPQVGLELEVSLSGQGVGGSDHQTFLKRSIPALHFFSGLHADYHRPSDDHERVEAEGVARAARLVLLLLERIQATAELPWVAPASEPGAAPRGGFRTRFGSIPDYAYDGPGLRLDGTSPGGPAEKAGLLRGDVIVAIDDATLDGLGDFMFVLNTHKPGDVLRVKYLRDGAEETCLVTLESSQVE